MTYTSINSKARFYRASPKECGESAGELGAQPQILKRPLLSDSHFG
jgi:hypothetical protein